MINDRALDVLRRTTLFAGFSEEQLQAVPLAAPARTFEPGDRLTSEGEEDGPTMWLVLDGEVEIRLHGQLLRTEKEGSYIGEMSLLTGLARSADVIAVRPTTALQLKHSHLRGLVHADPDVAMDVMAELARRFRRLNEAVGEMIRTIPAVAEAAREHGIEALIAPAGLDSIADTEER